MGTTVTTNLGLVKPDTDESIRENLPSFAGWADQNGTNCDKIDALFRHTSHTWVPVWTTDIASNPVLGTGGILEGKYIRLWPRMVLAYFRIFAGTAAFTPGSGLYRLSLPVAVDPLVAGMANTVPMGQAYLHDNDVVATSSIMTPVYDVVSSTMTFRRYDGDFWRHNNPITLAINDRVSGYFMYPTAAA